MINEGGIGTDLYELTVLIDQSELERLADNTIEGHPSPPI